MSIDEYDCHNYSLIKDKMLNDEGNFIIKLFNNEGNLSFKQLIDEH